MENKKRVQVKNGISCRLTLNILLIFPLHAYGKRTGVGKVPGLSAHIVLKLPFLLQNDALRNIDAVIDLTDITPKTTSKLCIICLEIDIDEGIKEEVFSWKKEERLE
ncbi:unnamed protein product [Rhizophagus irregularis]|nr:unnamed protein product [Rhizophagus irregularis]